MVVFHTCTASIISLVQLPYYFFCFVLNCKAAVFKWFFFLLRYYLRQWYISDFALQFHVVSPFCSVFSAASNFVCTGSWRYLALTGHRSSAIKEESLSLSWGSIKVCKHGFLYEPNGISTLWFYIDFFFTRTCKNICCSLTKTFANFYQNLNQKLFTAWFPA